jgi:hypothetical protein
MKHKKYILLILLAVVFIASGLYNNYNSKNYLFYLNNPAEHDLAEISIAGTIISKDQGNIILRENVYGIELPIKSAPSEWEKGQYINCKGIFHKECYIEYKRGELIWNKEIKFEFSAIGFLFFLFILFRDYKKLKFDF